MCGMCSVVWFLLEPYWGWSKPPTVVVVDRRGRSFNFWASLHHQQFQSRNKHEKNKFSKQSLAVSPCPTSSGLDACHRFLEKRPVRREDVCPWVYLYELCCALDCVKFFLNCFGPYRSMQDKVVDIPPKDQKDSKGIIPTSGALDCTVCHHGLYCMSTDAIESKTIHPNLPQRMLQISGLGIFQRLTFFRSKNKRKRASKYITLCSVTKKKGNLPSIVSSFGRFFLPVFCPLAGLVCLGVLNLQP